MANYLKVSMRETIMMFLAKGWSARRVARELGVNRRTVAKYAMREQAKRATVTAGSDVDREGVAESKRATVTAGSGTDGAELSMGSKRAKVTAGSPSGGSLCSAYHEYVESRLAQGFSAQRIYQDLVLERDFAGGYESVKRYARKLSDRSELPFRRMETAPGKEVQVDYGAGAWVRDSQGKRRRTHLFRIVLSCSRKCYSEVSHTQDTESFIRALENAFQFFGGSTETVVIDNLKAGVITPLPLRPGAQPQAPRLRGALRDLRHADQGGNPKAQGENRGSR